MKIGKTLTLISKGIAVIFSIGMFAWSERSAAEIVIICGFIAEAFIVVDISKIIKNAKSKE